MIPSQLTTAQRPIFPRPTKGSSVSRERFSEPRASHLSHHVRTLSGTTTAEKIFNLRLHRYGAGEPAYLGRGTDKVVGTRHQAAPSPITISTITRGIVTKRSRLTATKQRHAVMDILAQLSDALVLAKPFVPMIIFGTFGLLANSTVFGTGPLAVPDQPQRKASASDTKRGSVFGALPRIISYIPLRTLSVIRLRYQQHLMLGMPLSNT